MRQLVRKLERGRFCAMQQDRPFFASVGPDVTCLNAKLLALHEHIDSLEHNANCLSGGSQLIQTCDEVGV